MILDAMKQALEVLSLELPIGSHLELKNDLRAAIEQAQEPWVRTIKTWQQRCDEHPDHNGIVTERMIQARMQEEIDELRAAIEQAHGDWDEVEALRASLREHMAEIHRLQSALGQAPVAWVYQEGLEALKSGRPWTAYGSSGEGRIPLYLNDAVARRVEPPAAESGAGFESLPASPSMTTWWHEPSAQMNYRPWQGLTDDKIVLICGECAASHADDICYARAIEAKLRDKNA